MMRMPILPALRGGKERDLGKIRRVMFWSQSEVLVPLLSASSLGGASGRRRQNPSYLIIFMMKTLRNQENGMEVLVETW